ncbi:MAG: hypothetical protein JNM16_08550 [Dechloromonas sp.]|nr:hypothetical protein [Dechloromonas sp.]
MATAAALIALQTTQFLLIIGQRPDTDALDTGDLRRGLGQHAQRHVERCLLEIEAARQGGDALLQLGWRHQRGRISARIEHASHGIHNSLATNRSLN